MKTDIFIFSPHCDDAALSLGSSILNKILKGNIKVITIFNISDYNIIEGNGGEVEKMTKLREDEEKKVMNILRVKNEFWDYKEFPLRAKKTSDKLFNENYCPKKDHLFKEIYKKIEGICSKNKSAIFLFPMGIGFHSDHSFLKEIGITLLNKKGFKIYFYEDQPYAGMENLSSIDIFAKKLILNPKRLTFWCNNVIKKMSLLKNYKSQFDAEDIGFTFLHTQRRRGECIWSSKRNIIEFSNLNIFNLSTVENKLVQLPEYFFDRDFRVNLIKEFTGIETEDILKQMKDSTQDLAKDWKEKYAQDMAEFYSRTMGYIFELENWHIEDKMKQAGIICIASNCLNKVFLEYGCGIADTSIAASIAGAKEVHALDLPSKTLNYAKYRSIKFNLKTKIKFIESNANIRRLILPENYYDVVSAEDVFEHVEDPLVHAKVIYNCLNKGGILFFSTEFIHSDFHPMHLKSNERFNGSKWLYELEKLGFEIVSPCQAIKK